MLKKISLLFCMFFMLSNLLYSQEYTTIKDIPYRNQSDPLFNDTLCRLDLYYPKDKKDFATVIWYHGGGLGGGSKEIPIELCEKGYAIAAIGYRLVPNVKVIDCIDDAAAAAAWVKNHIKEYRGNDKLIFVSGFSAGGYLSYMITMDKSHLAKYSIDPDTSFVATLAYSGQAITHFARRRELEMKDTQPLIDELSPLYHVRPDCIPMLIMTGDREIELLGRYEENAYLYRMFKLTGHKDVNIKEFDGFDHGEMQKPGHYISLKYMNERVKNFTQIADK